MSTQPASTHVALPDSLDGALVAIGDALGFPGHYRANLDALADCLRDLEQPTELVLDGWQQLAWRDPQGWRRLRQVLDQRTAEGEPATASRLLRPGVAPLPGFTVQRG